MYLSLLVSSGGFAHHSHTGIIVGHAKKRHPAWPPYARSSIFHLRVSRQRQTSGSQKTKEMLLVGSSRNLPRTEKPNKLHHFSHGRLINNERSQTQSSEIRVDFGREQVLSGMDLLDQSIRPRNQLWNQFCESHSRETGLYWDRRLIGAHSRFRGACETLVRVRKLSRNTPALQFNIATSGGQQVNLAK